MNSSDFWNNPKEAQNSVAQLKKIKLLLKMSKDVDDVLADLQTALELIDENPENPEILVEAEEITHQTTKKLNSFEMLTLFNDELDNNNAYLSIQAGSGGTEASDWAEMLMRMYLIYCDNKGFKAEITEIAKNEEAGIKFVQIHIRGNLAFGLLKSEIGIHRLVRASPFDSNHRRHTSFAAVDVIPEVDDEIDIQIDEKDLKIETFCASGKGGQHVNRTESAVRIKHIPTNIVVSCQNERSQHHNKDQAFRMLKAKLYQLEKSKRDKEANRLYNEKGEISWGNQIRSYILDDSRVKDHRTNIETFNPNAVLEGEIDVFIEGYHRWRKKLSSRKNKSQ